MGINKREGRNEQSPRGVTGIFHQKEQNILPSGLDKKERELCSDPTGEVVSTSISLRGVGVGEKGEGEFLSHVHGRSQMMKQNYEACTVETNFGTRKRGGQSLGKSGRKIR